jgi:hypothetical protein
MQLALFRNLIYFMRNCYTMYLIVTFSRISSIISDCAVPRSIEIQNSHDIYTVCVYSKIKLEYISNRDSFAISLADLCIYFSMIYVMKNSKNKLYFVSKTYIFILHFKGFLLTNTMDPQSN